MFEYQKDLLLYAIAAGVILGYRHYRRQGLLKPVLAPAPQHTLTVHSGHGERQLPLADINYLESAANYVSVFSGGREFLVRETLANMGQRLAADGFQRIHRRYIINLRRVEEVSAREVQLREGPRLPLGRSFRDAFRAALQQGDAAARPGP